MAAPDDQGGSETILVAEDDGCVRRIAARTLVGLGYAVLEAAHGAQAFELGVTHNGAIHLLVTDLVMPYMSGRALADQLRLGRPDLKVLYVSGYEIQVIPEMNLELCASFLAKPYRPSILARRVRELLDSQVQGPCPDHLSVGNRGTLDRVADDAT